MTEDTDDQQKAPESGSDGSQGPQRPADDQSRYREIPQPKFNPFANEEDMFKIVLLVGGVVFALVLLAVLAQAVF